MKNLNKLLLVILWLFSIIDVSGINKAPKIVLPQLNRLTEISQEITNLNHKAIFPGGEDELDQFLLGNIHFPAMQKNTPKLGNTLVKLYLNKKGKIINIEFINSINPLIDKEIKRVIKKMPRWIPAVQSGDNVKSFVIIPIHTHG